MVCGGVAEGRSESSQVQVLCLLQKYNSAMRRTLTPLHSDGWVVQWPAVLDILLYLHDIILYLRPFRFHPSLVNGGITVGGEPNANLRPEQED